jgi:hypothetical protein
VRGRPDLATLLADSVEESRSSAMSEHLVYVEGEGLAEDREAGGARLTRSLGRAGVGVVFGPG